MPNTCGLINPCRLVRFYLNGFSIIFSYDQHGLWHVNVKGSSIEYLYLSLIDFIFWISLIQGMLVLHVLEVHVHINLVWLASWFIRHTATDNVMTRSALSSYIIIVAHIESEASEISYFNMLGIPSGDDKGAKLFATAVVASSAWKHSEVSASRGKLDYYGLFRLHMYSNM